MRATSAGSARPCQGTNKSTKLSREPTRGRVALITSHRNHAPGATRVRCAPIGDSHPMQDTHYSEADEEAERYRYLNAAAHDINRRIEKRGLFSVQEKLDQLAACVLVTLGIEPEG